MLELHKRSPRLPHRKNVGKESLQRVLVRAPRIQDRACGGWEDWSSRVWVIWVERRGN